MVGAGVADGGGIGTGDVSGIGTGEDDLYQLSLS